MTVLTTGTVKRNIRAKENFTDNPGDNIFRRFDVLPNFLFITCERKHDD